MKYFLGFLAVVAVGILAIVLLTSGGPAEPGQSGERQVTVTDYASGDAVVRLTVQGEIEAKEEHREIRITVGRNRRNIEILRGYDAEVIKSRPFDNSQAAYDEFLHALEKAGFANSQDSTVEDEEGVCPTGRRYIYEMLDNSEQVLRLWSTSCSRRDGTLAGNANLIRQLFEAQIPDYTEFARDVRL
jgi:hypothetical protein